MQFVGIWGGEYKLFPPFPKTDGGGTASLSAAGKGGRSAAPLLSCSPAGSRFWMLAGESSGDDVHSCNASKFPVTVNKYLSHSCGARDGVDLSECNGKYSKKMLKCAKQKMIDRSCVLVEISIGTMFPPEGNLEGFY